MIELFLKSTTNVKTGKKETCKKQREQTLNKKMTNLSPNILKKISRYQEQLYTHKLRWNE
jgi:hypothetical protein